MGSIPKDGRAVFFFDIDVSHFVQPEAEMVLETDMTRIAYILNPLMFMIRWPF